MNVFKLYKVEMAMQQNNLALFDFEDQLTNMYRSGAFYADKDYNKISLSKQEGFTKFEENLAVHHNGNSASRDNGLIINKHKATVSFGDYLQNNLLV